MLLTTWDIWLRKKQRLLLLKERLTKVCKTKNYLRLKLNAIIALHCIAVKRDVIMSVNEKLIQLYIYLLKTFHLCKSRIYWVSCEVRTSWANRHNALRPTKTFDTSILSAHTLSYEIYGISTAAADIS